MDEKSFSFDYEKESISCLIYYWFDIHLGEQIVLVLLQMMIWD